MKMKQLFSTALIASLFAACSPQGKTIDKQEIIHKLSLEDKTHFVIGTGMEHVDGNNAVIGATKSIVPGAAGTTYPLLHAFPYWNAAGFDMESRACRGSWQGYGERSERVRR